MAEKKFNGAPFGTQTSRFDVSGVHPKNKVPGTFTQTPYCRKSTSDTNTLLGPGRYDVEHGGFSSKSVESAASGPGWARAYEVSRMAALPHLLYKEQWQQKKLLDKKLGPGKYNIKDFLEHKDEKPHSTLGIIQTLEPRFREVIQKEETPGPGTYGGGGVPHTALEEKKKKSASTIGMLDSGSSRPRSLPNVGSKLGPGSYEIDSFTDEMSKKLISVRGPYDLFSGDRNKPIKIGHFAAPLHANLGPGQYNLKSFLDENNTIHKIRHGRFKKMHEVEDKPTERIYSFTLSQNPRKQNEPGPGMYEVHDTHNKSSHAQKSPGFLSSAQRNDRTSTKFFTGNNNPVGPGRYDIQRRDESQNRNGHSSVFRSKTMKPDTEHQKFLQERIRSKDVPLKDRVFIVPPSGPHELTSNFAMSRTVTVA